MATRNSNRTPHSRARSGDRPRTHPEFNPEKAQQATERARRRLQKASAVLVCLELAADEAEDQQLDVADVANVVRELVNQATDGLDSVQFIDYPEE